MAEEKKLAGLEKPAPPAEKDKLGAPAVPPPADKQAGKTAMLCY